MIPLILITRAPNASVGGGSCQHQTVAAPSRWIRPVRCFPASVASQKPVIISIRRSFCELPAAPAGTAQRWGSHPCQHALPARAVRSTPFQRSCGCAGTTHTRGAGRSGQISRPLASWHPGILLQVRLPDRPCAEHADCPAHCSSCCRMIRARAQVRGWQVTLAAAPLHPSGTAGG